jgi:hypothetical protein
MKKNISTGGLKAIQIALNLPTTYKIIKYVKGNAGKEYIELAELHSGTGGHNSAFAIYTHDTGWLEISQQTWLAHAKQILNLETAVLS